MVEIPLKYWELDPELSLMLDIVLRRGPAVPEGVDWDRFDQAVRRHRVQPLLIRGLRAMDADTVEKTPALKKYRNQQNQYIAESFQRLQALVQVGTALADAGIRMISMKGPLLSMELYGDPSLRTSRDLDVMVAEEDMERSGAILEELGYELEMNHFHKTPLRRRYYGFTEMEKHAVYNCGGICLELHWKDNFQSDERFDDLWERREEQMVFGRKIAVMGAADRYPALIIHAAEHGFHRLRWLLDLYELQKKPAFRWETVFAQLSAQGLGSLLLETMLVMYRLRLPGLEDVAFEGVSLIRRDDGITLRLREDLAREGDLARRLSDAAYPLWQSEVDWGDPRQRAYDKLLPTSLLRKSLLQQFFINFGPSTHELELIDLPDWLFWLYFIIRPFHWLRRKLARKV